MMMRSTLFANMGALLIGSVALSGCGESPETTSSEAGGSGGSVDTGGEGGATGSTSTTDDGMPSDVYPAPHPDPPQLAWQGGAVLESPKILPVYFAGDDPAITSKLTELSNKIAGSKYWEATTSEYGVGPLSVLPPVVVNEAPGATVTDADIQAWLTAKLNADDPQLAGVDESTIVTLYYPAGVTVVLDGASSCQSFASYHFQLPPLDDAHGNRSIAYAVVPRCEVESLPAGFTALDGLTATTTAQWINAALNPLPASDPAWQSVDEDHLYWSVLAPEATNLCARSKSSYPVLPDLGFRVHKSWSNQAATTGHDPCVPQLPGEVYFNAAPVLPDEIIVGDSNGDDVTIHALTLAKGESKTIDVRLFSDAKTDGPFEVTALDVGVLSGSIESNLSFEWDRNQGVNGETLHLTITGVGDLANGELLVLYSRMGNQEHWWLGYVRS